MSDTEPPHSAPSDRRGDHDDRPEGHPPLTPPPDPRCSAPSEDAGLSARLQHETSRAHEEAEHTAFIHRFLQGTIDRITFTRMVASHLHVYEAMESALHRHRSHPVAGRLWFPELLRARSLRADYEYLCGKRARQPTPSPATREYVGRFDHVAEAAPHLLVGHAYTRYMGDLSGGQVLRRVASKSLGLCGEGLTFYEFPQIPKKRAFKASFRRMLDTLPLSPGQATEVVAEANHAFVLNIKVFAELTSLEAG